MDIDRINKVISYVNNNVDSVNKADEISDDIIEKTLLDDSNVEKIDNEDQNTVTRENYGADRYLICNPNMLYRYVNRSFISKNTFKVNKAAYAEAAKKYGYKSTTKKSCFEESYI